MADMLVRLYDLPDLDVRREKLERRGVFIRPPNAWEKWEIGVTSTRWRGFLRMVMKAFDERPCARSSVLAGRMQNRGCSPSSAIPILLSGVWRRWNSFGPGIPP